VLSRWPGWAAALVATLVTGALVMLGGEMARALAPTASTPGQTSYPAARLDDAVQRLRTASTPLLQVLDPETRQVVLGDQSG